MTAGSACWPLSLDGVTLPGATGAPSRRRSAVTGAARLSGRAGTGGAVGLENRHSPDTCDWPAAPSTLLTASRLSGSPTRS